MLPVYDQILLKCKNDSITTVVLKITEFKYFKPTVASWQLYRLLRQLEVNTLNKQQSCRFSFFLTVSA